MTKFRSFISIIIFLVSFIWISCAYFNTYYNAEKYFHLESSLSNCYLHMATTATPKAGVSENLNGVIHYDNSSRIQICEKDQLLGKILVNLGQFGIYVIANTSFNISSDPMVYDKEDALLAVERMNIKFLLTETGLFKKK